MRNLIVAFFMLFGLVAFAQEGNKTDAKGQKQGEWKKYHTNGMLRYVGSFKNDKPLGEFKYYYDTGKIQSKMDHKEAVSYFIAYYKTGEVKATGKYINQKRDSVWNFYDVVMIDIIHISSTLGTFDLSIDINDLDSLWIGIGE